MEPIKRRRRPSQRQTTRADFHESLAQSQANYGRSSQPDEMPRILSPWAILAIIVLGLLVILAILVTFNLGVAATSGVIHTVIGA